MEFLLYIAAIGIAMIAAGAASKAFMRPQNSDGIAPAFFLTGAMLLFIGVVIYGSAAAIAHDNGQYAGSALHDWFEGLRSGKGPCCSDADGYSISDPDWSMEGGHYRVKVAGEWHDVPDDAVITEPNRAGKTMVWPVWSWQDGRQTLSYIRCFMPGAEI